MSEKVCKIVLNDCMDELREENNKLLNELSFERNLNNILENIRNYSLILINNCKCIQNNNILQKVIHLNNDLNRLKTNECKQQFDCEVSPKIAVNALSIRKRSIKSKQAVNQSLAAKRSATERKKRCFECDLCDYTSDKKYCFLTHYMTHSSLRPFQCDLNNCNKAFRTVQGLQQHKKTYNHAIPRLLCTFPDCGKSFRTTIKLTNHKRCHTKSGKAFKSYKRSEYKHKMISRLYDKINGKRKTGRPPKRVVNPINPPSDDRPTEAPISEAMTTTIELIMDSNDVNQEIIVANTDDTNDNNNELHSTENDSKTDNNSNLCLITDSKRRRNRKTNELNINYKQKTDVQCNECEDCFVNRNDLLSHLALKHGFSVFECDLCEYKSEYKTILNRHKLTHISEKPFKCDVNGCDKWYKTKDILNTHKKKSHKIRNKYFA